MKDMKKCGRDTFSGPSCSSCSSWLKRSEGFARRPLSRGAFDGSPWDLFYHEGHEEHEEMRKGFPSRTFMLFMLFMV
jgi:hypothetical protein